MTNNQKTFYFAMLASFFLIMGCDGLKTTPSGPGTHQQAGTKCADLNETLCKQRTDCQWHATSCADITTSASATYTVYDFGSVPDILFRPKGAGDISTVVSSKQGMVYLTGQQADNTLVIDRTDGQSWAEIALGTGAPPDDSTINNFSQNDVAAKITLAASLNDGVVVYEPVSNITAILLDDTDYAFTAWTLDEAGFGTEVPQAFFEIEKSPGNFFLYTALDVAANGLRYFDRTQPTNAWVGDYTQADGSPLPGQYAGFAASSHSLLLASLTSEEIFEINKTDVGVDDAAHKKLKADAASVTAIELQHVSGTANGYITSMLVVDNKYLLVGFNGSGNDDRGGLFYRDISGTLPLSPTQWDHTKAENHDVFSMIVDRNNSKRAVIATNVGIMIFEDGQVVKIDGKEVISPVMVSDPNNQGSLVKASAKTGLSGVMSEVPKLGIAQDKHGKFYFNTQNTLSTLVITSQDL